MAVALLVAAGGGNRLGADRPKAFVSLAGCSLVEWSIRALSAAPSIQRIVVAVPGDPRKCEWSKEPDLSGVILVAGGNTRAESVRNALMSAGDAEHVVVHDAARPFVTTEIIEATIAALADCDAALAAVPITDTVKEVVAEHRVVRTIDRSRLWSAQTPQAFRRAALEKALDCCADTLAAATDDASLVEATGGKVVVVPSSAENFKVTTQLDLRVAELVAASR